METIYPKEAYNQFAWLGWSSHMFGNHNLEIPKKLKQNLISLELNKLKSLNVVKSRDEGDEVGNGDESGGEGGCEGGNECCAEGCDTVE